MNEKFNKDQYILLMSCAVKEDFTEWNEYVADCDECIKLREANFDGIKINDAVFINKNGDGADFYNASFRNSKFSNVDMSDCNFMEADLSGVVTSGSTFQDSCFVKSELKEAEFALCDFSCASFQEAKLNIVTFMESKFYECEFYGADLSGAKFLGSGHNPLINQELRFNLCGTSFRNAKFTSKTYFGVACVSKETDFRTISFESACFSEGLKQTVQYCNRRHNWMDWYEKQSKLLSLLVKIFWALSDYGRSAKQVIKSFFWTCLFFAFVYFIFPSLINGLDSWQPISSIYFSVVTMTTLGYGDLHAETNNWIGQCLVMIHVLFGYVLLGALITVLSDLFSSDGPAQGLIKHPEKPMKIRFGMKSVT